MTTTDRAYDDMLERVARAHWGAEWGFPKKGTIAHVRALQVARTAVAAIQGPEPE